MTQLKSDQNQDQAQQLVLEPNDNLVFLCGTEAMTSAVTASSCLLYWLTAVWLSPAHACVYVTDPELLWDSESSRRCSYVRSLHCRVPSKVMQQWYFVCCTCKWVQMTETQSAERFSVCVSQQHYVKCNDVIIQHSKLSTVIKLCQNFTVAAQRTRLLVELTLLFSLSF